MKFKSDIEVQAGIKDKDGQTGSSGQILASTGSQVDWIDQDAIISAASKLVVIACKNTSGATITKGTPVYQTGTVGATDVIEVAEADASDEDKMAAIGLLQTNIDNNDFGNVVITGELLNFTTSPIDGVTPTTGDTIYVKPGGGLTLTKPTGVNFIQNVGLVGKVSGGNAGSLTVSSIMRSNDVPTPLYIDHDNQRLGIGATSPNAKLTVKGSGLTSQDFFHIEDSGGVRMLEVTSDAAGNTTLQVKDTSGTTKSLINSSGNSYFNGGNVGIGTTNPSANLDIEDASGVTIDINSSTGDGQFRFQDNGITKWSVGRDNTQQNFVFSSSSGLNSDNVLTLAHSSGNVGIGTTSPSEKLEVDGIIKVVHTDDSYANYRGHGVFFNRTENYVAPLADNTSTLNIGYNGAKWGNVEINGAFIKFENGPNEFMRIASSGNVGIGTTNPSAKLEVSAGVTTSVDIAHFSNSNNIAKAKISLSANSSGELSLIDGSNNTDVFITSNGNSYFNSGNVGIGTTSPGKKLDVVGNADVGVAKFSHTTNGAYGSILLGTVNLFTGDNGNYSWKNGSNTRMELSGAGALKLNTYTAGTLVSDASGNITVSSGGGAGGPYLPLAGGTMTGTNGVLMPDNFRLKIGTSEDLLIFHDGTDSQIFNQAGDLKIRNDQNDGDIVFMSDNGSGGVENYIQIDGSEGRTLFNKNTRLNDNVKAQFGGSGDFNIFHNGLNSYIENDTGDLYIRSNFQDRDIILQSDNGGGGIATYIQIDGSKGSVELNHYGAKKFETTAGGTINTGTIDSTGTITVTGANGNVGINTDTGKLLLGASYDLQIYHDGNDSYIKDSGTGDLRIDTSKFRVRSAGGAESMIIATENGSVDLYYNDLKKFETQSSGVSVSGGLTVSGTNSFLIESNSTAATFNLNSSVRGFDFINNNGTLLNLDSAGNGTFADQAFATTATSSGDASSTLTTKGYVDGLITGATIYRGAWDPSGGGYGSPDLSGVTQTSGYYYICSAAGTAEPNGTGTEPDTWETGDWVIYNDVSGTGQWQKIDNSSVLSGVGTGQTVALWEGAGSVTDSETLGNAPITVSGNDTTFAGSVTVGTKLMITSSSDYIDVISDDLYIVAADKNILYSGNAETLRLDESQNATFAGDVYIPEYIYHSGDTNTYIRFTADTQTFRTGGDDRLILTNTTATFAGNVSLGDAKFIKWGNGNQQILGNNTSGLSLYSNGERMRILTNGNVGIGTTSPSAKLHLEGDAIIEGVLRADNVNLGLGGAIKLKASNTLSDQYVAFGTTPSGSSGNATFTEKMRVTSSGNVGIGTTSPKSKLDVDGGVKIGDDTDTASADKVGTMRYRTDTEYVEVDGEELVTNGDFATDSDWNKGAGWTISGGSLNGSSTTSTAFQINTGLVSGKIYKVVYTISNYVSGSVRIELGSGNVSVGSIRSANGTYIEYIEALGDDRLYFDGGVSFTGSIDNVSVIEATEEDASYADMCMQTGSSTYEWVNIVRNTY